MFNSEKMEKVKHQNDDAVLVEDDDEIVEDKDENVEDEDEIVEDKILRTIFPYSEVQLDFVAKKIGWDRSHLERKLCEMILDKKLDRVLVHNSADETIIKTLEKNPEEQHILEIVMKILDNATEIIDLLEAKSCNYVHECMHLTSE